MRARRVVVGFVIGMGLLTWLASPVAAMAATKYSTRIFGVKSSVVVDNFNYWATATPGTVSGKLYRKVGTAYKPLAGTVRLYALDNDTKQWTRVSAQTKAAGEQFTFKLNSRGKYRITYPGTTTTYSTTTYTKRIDNPVSYVYCFTEVTPLDSEYSNLVVYSSFQYNINFGSAMLDSYTGFTPSNPETNPAFIPQDLSSWSSTVVNRPGGYATTFSVRKQDLLRYAVGMTQLSFDDPYTTSPWSNLHVVDLQP